MKTRKWLKFALIVLVVAMLPVAVAGAGGRQNLIKIEAHLVRGQPTVLPAIGPKTEAPALPDQNPLRVAPDKVAGPPPFMPIGLKEGFEYAWPNGTWVTWDNNGGDELCWDDTYYRHAKGGWSGNPNDGCANYISPPGPYAPHMDSWMMVGPISTSGAKQASAKFKYWLQSEPGYDYLCWGASVDLANFYGYCVSGTTANKFKTANFNLKTIPGYGSMLGYPQVWIAWSFYSDGSYQYEGAYVDEISITAK